MRLSAASSILSDLTQARRGFAIALLLAAGLALLSFGALGVLRSGDAQLDLWTLYYAGARFIDEMMPYGKFSLPYWGQTTDDAYSYYAYPPHFSPIAMAMALVSFGTAQIFSITINLLAAAVLAWVVGMMMRPAAGDDAAAFAMRRVVAMAVILMSPFAAHVIWLGNTTIVIAASLCGAWLLAGRGQAVAAGVLFACATWKPQFALLPAIWFFLERRSTLLATTAVVSLAMASWHILEFGLLTSIVEWLHALQSYATSANGSLGEHSFGVRELIFDLAGRRPRIEAAALAMLGLLWWKRRMFTSLEQLGLIVAIGVLLLPGQDYDLIILAPLAGAVLARPMRDWQALLVPAAGCFALFVPYRLVAKLDMPILTQWRVGAVLVIATWLVADVVRAARAAQADILAKRAEAALRQPRYRSADFATALAANTAQPSNPG